MEKKNCWEFMHCERQPGGRLVALRGVCPAATDKSLDAIHEGTNAGRACWVVTGTLCGGKVQGTEAHKQYHCWMCGFFEHVREEEKETLLGFSATMHGMRKVLLKKTG